MAREHREHFEKFKFDDNDLGAVYDFDKTVGGLRWRAGVEPLSPFPFISTCLLLGKPRAHCRFSDFPMYVCEAPCDDMGQLDCKHGVSFLDITDLTHVRYCFVNLMDEMDPVYKMRSFSHPPPDTPLSAIDYASHYKLKDELLRDDAALLSFFDGGEVIIAEALSASYTWAKNINVDFPVVFTPPHGPYSSTKYSVIS